MSDHPTVDELVADTGRTAEAMLAILEDTSEPYTAERAAQVRELEREAEEKLRQPREHPEQRAIRRRTPPPSGC